MCLVIRVILDFFAWENKFADINARCFGLFSEKVGELLELVIKVFAVKEIMEDHLPIYFTYRIFFFLDPLR